MILLLHNDWWPWLEKEWQEPYFQKLSSFIHEEYEHKCIYPEKKNVFKIFEVCPYKDVKVVILGQDPYHEPNQAHGMCFSVNVGVPIPPSLQNIYKELQDELGCYIPNNGYLMPWAKQGVFLLNTTMTVERGKANSHAGKGWDIFTDHVIEKINEKEEPVVFMLWGSNARSKAKMIDKNKHLVLEAPHPSPLSAYRGFFGCGHFKQANVFLNAKGREPIVWQIPNINK